MKLLAFAHRGEAQTFIRESNLKSHELLNELYIGDNHSLLITGEGHENVLSKTSFAIALLRSGGHQLNEVINLGICGSLTDQNKLNDILQIRTIYKEDEFKSFTTDSNQGLDLITVSQRILDKNGSQELLNIAPLVDRELWSLAFVCKNFQVKLNAYKMISDHISEAEFCQRIKENSEYYSDELYKFYEELIEDQYLRINIPDLNDDDFYFTVSQRRNFNSLIDQIAKKESIDIKSVIASLDLTKYKNRDITGKARAGLLVAELNARLYPFKTKVLSELQAINNQYEKYGVQFKYDSNLENCSFKFTCTVDSEEKQLLMSKVLKDYPWNTFSNLMNGNFDV